MTMRRMSFFSSRWTTAASVAGLVASLAGAGCSSGRSVYVQLQTDLVAGVEFDTVLLRSVGTRTIDVDTSDHFGRPVQVGEFAGIADGARFNVQVELRRDGEVVLERLVQRRVTSDAVVLVVISRNCLEVECPTASAPAATECLGGQCVEPDCEGSACVSPECVADGDCRASVDCVEPLCVEGVCLEQPVDARCEASEACVPETGCVPTSGAVDGGAVDGGAFDGGSGDAGAATDAGTDAAAGPTFELDYLAAGSSGWVGLRIDGALPTEAIEAVFANAGGTELLVVTASTVHVLRLADRTFISAIPRNLVFPEIAGDVLQEATTIGSTLLIYDGAGGWQYTWDDASRSATFVSYTARTAFGADWSSPYAASLYSVEALYYVPDSRNGWVTTDVTALCGRANVGPYVVFHSFDGIGPGTTQASVYDVGCAQFVTSMDVARFAPMAVSGAPGRSVIAGEYVDGLYLFVAL